MNTLMKFFLFILIVVLMGFGFHFGSYQDKINKITVFKAQQKDQNKEIARLKGMAEKLTEWERAKKEFGTILASFQKGMALKDFIPSFLVDIERLTAEQRVRMNDPSFKVLTLSPGATSATVKPTPKKEEGKTDGAASAATSSPAPVESAPVVGAQKVAIQLTMEGRFDTLLDFFQQLTDFKLNKLVTLQRLSLAPKEKTGRGAPVLSITIPMEAYMFGEGGGQ